MRTLKDKKLIEICKKIDINRELPLLRLEEPETRFYLKYSPSSGSIEQNVDMCVFKAVGINDHRLLEEKLKEKMIDLIENNVLEYYVCSSLGWNRKHKEREIFCRSSRFVILTIPHNCAHTKSSNTDKETFSNSVANISAQCLQQESLAGFLCFRFDFEKCNRKEIPVIYCYEIQILPEYQSQGLGRYMINTMLELGKKYKLKKLMLTHFKDNIKAGKFYRRLGIMYDETSDVNKKLETKKESGGGDGQDKDGGYEILSIILLQ